VVQRPTPLPAETNQTPSHPEGGGTVKRAKVCQRRRLADGRIMVNVVCPVCDHRHWLPVTATGECPRRSGRFTISEAVR
jgi:hypothetical protein